MKGIALSAVITNYNYSRYLFDAVSSVCTQTEPVARIIVVDDGSTDESELVLQQLEALHDERIIIVRKKNGGQADAINSGLELVDEGIVAMLDGDDMWLPNKAAEVVRAFVDNPDAVMVQHPLDTCDRLGAIVRRHRSPSMPSGDLRRLMKRTGGANVFEPTSGLSFRTSSLKKWTPLPIEWKICADGPLVYGAVATGPIVSLNQPLGLYRLHGENSYASKHRDSAVSEERMQAIIDFYNTICTDPELACVSLTDQLSYRRRRYYRRVAGERFLPIAKMIFGNPLYSPTQKVKYFARFVCKSAFLTLSKSQPSD